MSVLFRLFLAWIALAGSAWGAIDPSLNARFVNSSQEALQQLRTLIPERLWVQEFSIRIDRRAFKERAHKWVNHRAWEKEIDSSFSLASSHRYLLRSTLSGESIRMLDLYQEFEFSPFWRTPEAIFWLNQTEKELLK